MHKKLLTTTGLVLGVVLLFAVNIIAGDALGWVRLDLTDNGLYTLSPGTRHILAKLDDPITLRLYISENELHKVPQIASYANRVKTLLQEYARRSHGRIQLHVINPEPFSEEEDRAVAYGLRGLPLGGDETLYFGLVGTSSTDAEDVIPYLSTDREQFLEYDVTKLIHKLANPKRPIVGLISSLPIEGMGRAMAMTGAGEARPWAVDDQIHQLFDVHSLNLKLREIPSDIDVLMLVHPQKLPEQVQYAIDQFVLRGGRVVAFVDPYCETQRSRMPNGYMMPPSNRRSNLDRLLKAWGVELEPDTVVADPGSAVTVRMNRAGREVTFEYPVWLNVQPKDMDAKDIVTGNLGNLSFGTPGSLVPVKGATTKFTPLVQSTDQAGKFTPEEVELATDPRNLLREFKPAKRRFTLVARVSGKVHTAFPDGPPSAKKAPAKDAGAASSSGGKEKPLPKQLKESKTDANLLIVADADMLADRFWVQVQNFLGTRLAVPNAANGSLVVNALDNLAGSNDLISVRNRGSFVRPFERIDALKRQAELRYREKEQELVRKLHQTETKLVDLERGKQGSAAEKTVLTDAQRAELIRFRGEKLRIRKDLRDVRHALRKNIETLEAWLKFANIGLVPILIALGGVVVALVRLHRRRVSMRGSASA